MMMMRTGRIVRVYLVALVVAALLAGLSVGGASATTAPGFRFTLKVVITNSGILLVPHRTPTGKLLNHYITAGGRIANFPRGTLVQFVFVNKGTKTYLPAIRVTNASQNSPLTPVKPLYTGSAVKPGHSVALFGNFYFRGSFQIEKLLGTKAVGQPIQLTIY
jgi:hypothetical protein